MLSTAHRLVASRRLRTPHGDRRSTQLLAALVGLALLAPAELLGQGNKPASGKSGTKTKAPGGSAAGSRGMGPPGMMPGAMPGSMPGGGGGPPGMSAPGMVGAKPAKKKKKTAKGAQPAQELDEAGLPRDYTVPPEPPDWLTDTQEWDFNPYFAGEGEKEEKETKKNHDRAKSRYKDLISKGEFVNGEADRKLVADYVQYQLAQLTLKENRESAWKKRADLYGDIMRSGTAKNSKRDVRIFVMKTVAEQAPRLFGYHLVARLNGAILLADISDLNEYEAEGRNPAVRFTGAYRPLIDVLNQVDEKNRKQPDSVRVWGVVGLTRIGSVPELKSSIRAEIVETLVKQMTDSAGDHYWLQMRVAEGLGSMGLVYNNSTEKKPVVPQALAEVLVDTRRPPLVRAEAAQSLGRLPLDRDIDLGLIAHQIAQLAQQLAVEYQKSPHKSEWKLAFVKLYLAFKPANDDDAKNGRGLLTLVNSKGTLAGHKKLVQDSFDVVRPLVERVVNPGDNIAEPLQKLTEWLGANPPRTTRIAEKENPIISDKPFASEKPRTAAPPDPPPAGAGGSAG